MKKFRIAAFLLLLLPFCLPADASEPFSFNVYGYMGEAITIEDVAFDPDRDFNAATTTYSPALARLSEQVGFLTGGGGDEVLPALGFCDYHYADHRRTALSPQYQTGYFTARQQIQRNGRDCKLLLIGVHSNSNGDSMPENFDFLNYEMTGSATDLDSTLALTFTKASERILSALQSEIDAMRTGDGDYLIWITGHSRGGAVGNYLAKLLVDQCGTEHVTAYLFATPNVDKGALKETDTSRYNCIFNVINPDDAVPYFPMDRQYPGWGFARWGVDLYLRAVDESSDIYPALQQKYYAIVQNAPADGIISMTYPCFPKAESGGAALRGVVDGMVANLAENAHAYYTGQCSLRRKTVIGASTEYWVPYEVFRLAFTASSASDLYDLAVGSYYYPCDARDTLKSVLKYGFGTDDLLAFAAEYAAGQPLKFGPGISPHLPESYLAWLELEGDGVTIYQDSMVQDSEHCLDSMSAGDVTICGEGCFYDDQRFSAEATGKGWRIALTYPDDTACESYGAVTARFPAPEGTGVLFRAADGRLAQYASEYDARSGCCSVRMESCNGELILLDEGEQVALAGYSEAGKLLWVSLLSQGLQHQQTAASVRQFRIGADFRPLGARR